MLSASSRPEDKAPKHSSDRVTKAAESGRGESFKAEQSSRRIAHEADRSDHDTGRRRDGAAQSETEEHHPAVRDPVQPRSHRVDRTGPHRLPEKAPAVEELQGYHDHHRYAHDPQSLRHDRRPSYLCLLYTSDAADE